MAGAPLLPRPLLKLTPSLRAPRKEKNKLATQAAKANQKKAVAALRGVELAAAAVQRRLEVGKVELETLLPHSRQLRINCGNTDWSVIKHCTTNYSSLMRMSSGDTQFAQYSLYHRCPLN